MITSPIVDFYLGRGPDSHGRMVDDILSWDDKRLEDVHNYIQWLFPLKERSAFNASAPLLDEKEIDEFRRNDALKEKLRESFDRLLGFYGFSRTGSTEHPDIVLAGDAELRLSSWLTPYNHNFLRITRILKCLCLLGLESCATAFIAALERLYEKRHRTIGEETMIYWRKAVRTGQS